MRLVPALLATTATLAAVGLSTAPSQAASTAPGFTTVLIPGTIGAIDPGDTVWNKVIRCVEFNISICEECAYQSGNG